MSKKNTTQKTGKTISAKSPDSKSVSTPPSHQGNAGDTASLIFFDKKVKIFLLVMLGLYFIASFSKLHTSSVGMWELYFGAHKAKSVIAGTPRPIRQDEWMLGTTTMIGQYRMGFPISSQTLGAGNVPAMFGFPIKDFSMVLRPNLWPYFILDVERAFAFSWNFTIFFFIITTFLLFMLLTRSNFWLSLAGSFFIFLSGGMQWWSYWLGGNMIYLNGIILATVYLLYGKNIKTLIFAGIILLISSYSFVVNLYPPWQVPLVYLYLAIFAGFLIQRKDIKTIGEKIGLRVSVLSLTGIVLLFFFYHYYGLIKETSELIMNTAYPGKRSTNGGDLISGKLFSEFFAIYMSDDHLPSQWLNICEASGFIMFFPIVFYGIGYNYYKTRKWDWQLILQSLSVIVLLIWVITGFPSFLSKITLLSMSPVYRTLPVLGVANCILLICFLGSKQAKQTTIFSRVEFGILAAAILIFMVMVGNHINSSTSDFFSSTQIYTVAFLITIAYLLIRYKHIKYAQPALGLLLLGMTIPNIKIHPLTSGLSAVLENPLVKATDEFSKKEPEARWAVFGDQHVSNLLKANGMNVFNGVKTVPLLKDMAVLDPTGRDNFIYNRYAHINMFGAVDMKDSIQFKLNENEVVNDNYSIMMDPSSPRLRQLGIKYFLFTYKPKPIEVRELALVKDLTGMFIYKQNN